MYTNTWQQNSEFYVLNITLQITMKLCLTIRNFYDLSKASYKNIFFLQIFSPNCERAFFKNNWNSLKIINIGQHKRYPVSISYLSIYASSGGFYTFEVPVANYSLKFIFQIHDVKKFFSLCRQISFIPRTALRILTHFVRYIFQLTFKKHRWCNFWIHIFVSGIDVSKLFCWFVLNNVPFQTIYFYSITVPSGLYDMSTSFYLCISAYCTFLLEIKSGFTWNYKQAYYSLQ